MAQQEKGSFWPRHTAALAAVSLSLCFWALRIWVGRDKPESLVLLDWLLSPGLGDSLLVKLQGAWDYQSGLVLGATLEAIALFPCTWLMLRLCPRENRTWLGLAYAVVLLSALGFSGAFVLRGSGLLLPVLGLGAAFALRADRRFRSWLLLALGLCTLVAWPAGERRFDPYPERSLHALQQYLEKGDKAVLEAGLAPGWFPADRLTRALRQADEAGLLPPPLRTGMPLVPVRQSGFGKVAASQVATPPSGMEADAWLAEKGRSGAFESQPLESRAGNLRLRISGVLGAGNRVILVDTQGREHEPVLGELDSRGQWRQIRFEAPSGSFRLRATSEGRQPLAFAGLTEHGRYSWVASRLWDHWPWVLVPALAAFAYALFRLWCQAREGASDRSPFSAFEWSLLRWGGLCLWLVFLVRYVDFHAGGSDSSGYMNEAQMMLKGTLSLELKRPVGLPSQVLDDAAFAPLGMVLREGHRLVPTYPPGLPLLIAGLGCFFPLPVAAALCSLLHLGALAVLTRMLALELGLDRVMAWLAGALAAFCPLVVFMGLQPMSDVPAAVWCTAALWLAWKGRQQDRWLLAAGFAFGFAVLLRPTNALLIFPLLLIVGLNFGRLLRLGLGVLPAALFQLWLGWHLHGNPLATGYGDVRGLFALSWVPMTLEHYVFTLPLLLGPLVFFFWLFPLVKEQRRLLPLSLLLWAVLLAGVYASYFCTHETWWYNRFLLPAFPAFILCGMLGLQALCRSVCLRLCLPWLLVANLVFVVLQGARLGSMESASGNRHYAESARWAAELPENGLLIACQCSGAVTHYAGRPVANVSTREQAAGLVAWNAKSAAPLHALITDLEKEALFARFQGGRWTELRRSGFIALYRWERGR